MLETSLSQQGRHQCGEEHVDDPCGNMHIDAQEIRQGGAGGGAWKYLEVDGHVAEGLGVQGAAAWQLYIPKC